ncbi:glycosyltransferase [Rhizobium lusitanum]|uniref:Glycosyltransferase involved in cell wall biosynthesis n=1 Tax=Rhizobium lusitanum TaxID=293958 RepID=A0A7X0MF64_9HYPH|nr:glycosyltransferase [Rhizobium lusitanum]MBB6486713.1 glycosyltransferase involved in cell wall biosynthesis [Rhizobium lusitanum]
MGKPVILVIAPMPVFPCSAGNRRRLLSTCDFLRDCGFEIDFVYLAHEDQIYRRFAQTPPTDQKKMQEYFRRVWFLELKHPIRLNTGASAFELDDWCPEELNDFVRWYFEDHGAASAVLVNYVFLSACLLQVPAGVLRIIDTHDKFSERRNQYLPFRLAPNFFYTSPAAEKEGLSRADIVIAIQPTEQKYFSHLIGREVSLLMPNIPVVQNFVSPTKVRAIGFMGHGNDANLVSISQFASAWQQVWQPSMPVLLIAGEICKSMPSEMGPGVKILGYVEKLSDFFNEVDIVIAPMLMGTGLKLKVIEALAHGKPLVGTSVAFEGLEAQSPDHNFRSIHDMISRIQGLAATPKYLVELTAASKFVFEAYSQNVDLGAKRLSDKLSCAHVSRSSNLPPLFPSTDTRSSSHQIGPLVLTSAMTLGLSEVADHAIYGKPLATEFLVSRTDHHEWQTCSAPERRSWWVRLGTNSVESREELWSLAGKRINIAPSFTDRPMTDEAKKLQMLAMKVLSTAEPDWSTAAIFVAADSDNITITFQAPSFLLHQATRSYAFILHDGPDGTVRLEGVAISPLSFLKLPPLTMTSRCGDTSSLPMVLRAVVTQHLPTTSFAPTKLLLISNGLCGHVELNQTVQ